MNKKILFFFLTNNLNLMVITAENSWKSNQLTTDTPMTVECEQNPEEMEQNQINDNYVYTFDTTNNCGQMIPKLSQDDQMIPTCFQDDPMMPTSSVAPSPKNPMIPVLSENNQNVFSQIFNHYNSPSQTPVLPSESGVFQSSLPNNQQNINDIVNYYQPNTNEPESFLKPRLKTSHLLFNKRDIDLFDFDNDVTFIDTTSHKPHEKKKLKLREKKYERKLRKNIEISKIKNQ